MSETLKNQAEADVAEAAAEVLDEIARLQAEKAALVAALKRIMDSARAALVLVEGQ